VTLIEARPALGLAAALAVQPAGARVTAMSVPVPMLDPVALAGAALARGLEVAAWLRPDEGLSIVGVGRAWAVEPSGADRFADSEAAWTTLAGDLAGAEAPDDDGAGGPHGPVLLGGLGFWPERAAETGTWATFPVASLVLPSLTYVRRGAEAWLTVAVATGSEPVRGVELEATWADLVGAGPTDEPDAHPTLVGRARSTPDRAGWERLVGLMAGAVGRGRLDKVVLARRADIELRSAVDAAAVLGALAAGTPQGAAFLFARDGRAFLGATPERLVRVEGRAFRTVAIAGSTRRGRDADEDAGLAAALLASDKDREEHAVVVEMLRAELAPVAAELRVASEPGVLALRDLHHLVTPIEGVLRERAGILGLAGLLHPTPAVGGAPTDAALAMLAEHEGFDRGWYAGPVGWVGPDGDGELMVALRSGVVDGPRVSLFAGCGIVADSDGAREWAESRMKLRPMLTALGLDPDDTEAVP
jgi:isochorismate synthase